MNATVERIVELLFEELVMSEEVSAIKDEVMNNCQERFEDLISEGMDEDSAIGAVVESLKGMDEILAKYSRKEKEEPDEDAGDDEDAEQALTFATAGLNKITVAMIDREVKVEPSEDDQVHVIGEDVKSLEIKREDGSLRIEENVAENGQPANGQRPPYFYMSFKNKSKTWNANDFKTGLKNMIQDMCNGIKNGVFSGAGVVTLQLPEEFMPELNVSVCNGDAEVNDVRLSGLSVSTINGDIDVELPDDVMLERVKLDSKSGDVEATVYARDVSAQSISGDVRLEGSMETVKVNSTSGDVCLQVDAAQLRFRTVSGDADIRCEGDRLQEITGGSVSGDIDVELPDDVQAQVTTSTVSGDVSNSHHAGGSRVVQVKLNSVSGDIRVE